MVRNDSVSPEGAGRIARFMVFGGTPRGALILALVVTGLAYLVFVQPAFLLTILPFSFLLLCLLMHVFMHRRHGGHGGSGTQSGHRH